MNAVPQTSVIGRTLDPFSRCLDGESAERVAEYRIDPTVQARVDALAETADEGLPTPEGRAEYGAYIDAEDFIAIPKLKARRYQDANV